MSYKIRKEVEVITTQIEETEVTLMGYVGHTLKEAREAKGLGLMDVSRLTTPVGGNTPEVSNSTISRMEKGEYTNLAGIEAVAKALGLKVRDLFPKED